MSDSEAWFVTTTPDGKPFWVRGDWPAWKKLSSNSDQPSLKEATPPLELEQVDAGRKQAPSWELAETLDLSQAKAVYDFLKQHQGTLESLVVAWYWYKNRGTFKAALSRATEGIIWKGSDKLDKTEITSFLEKLQSLLGLTGEPWKNKQIWEFLNSLFEQLQNHGIIAGDKLNKHLSYFKSDAFEKWYKEKRLEAINEAIKSSSQSKKSESKKSLYPLEASPIDKDVERPRQEIGYH